MGVAVIVPFYNTEKYIIECLESLVKQTHAFDQIILIDDGSTDRSFQICQEYERKYANVLLFSQKNQGQGVARNYGLEKVCSEYVMFVDSDDYIREDTVEKIILQMTKEHLDILYFDSDIKNELNQEVIKNFYDRIDRVPREIMCGRRYYVECYPQAYVVMPCMAVFRSSFLKKNQIIFPPYRIFEDAVFSFRAMLNAEKVLYLPEKFYMRRYRRESTMTGKLTFERWTEMWLCHFICWNYILEKKEEWNKKENESMRFYLIHSYLELKRKSKEFQKNIYFETVSKEIQEYFCKVWTGLGEMDFDKISFRMAKKTYAFAHMLEADTDWKLNRFFCGSEFNIKQKALNKYISDLKDQFLQLPLKGEELRTGIYGTGYHTAQLLWWYQYLMGDILCELYFVDTYKKTKEESFMGYPVVNINDAGEYMDSIILSSYEYEHNMFEKTKEIWGSKLKIITFYENAKEDMFLNHEFCFS